MVLPMKTYEEMFQCVLARRDAYEAQRTRQMTAVRRMTPAAAAFLFAVVIGGHIWSQQTRLPAVPPSAPEEPAASPQPQTTECETSRTSAEPPQETDKLPALQTTAEPTEPTAPPTDVVQTTTVGTASRRQTIPPTDAAPVIAPVETAALTEPPTQAPTSALTELPTQSPTSAPTEAPTQAPTPAPTEAPTAEVPECVDTQLAGFRVEQYPAYRKIICTDAFPAPTGELQAYTVEGNSVELLSAEEPPADEPTRAYQVRSGGKEFTVTQREYAEFVLTIEDGELIDIGLNRVHGFFLLQDETCTLYWIRDGEGFCVSGDATASDLRCLLEIARSFTPAEN